MPRQAALRLPLSGAVPREQPPHSSVRAVPPLGVVHDGDAFTPPPPRLLRDATPQEIAANIGDFTVSRIGEQFVLRFEVPHFWAFHIDPASLQPMRFATRDDYGDCYSVDAIHYAASGWSIRFTNDRLVVTIAVDDIVPAHLPLSCGVSELCIGHMTVRFFQGRRIPRGKSVR